MLGKPLRENSNIDGAWNVAATADNLVLLVGDFSNYIVADRIGTSDAWQRSVRLAIQSELDLSLEPRVKSPPTDMTLTAEHPFFWSGYMVVDTGVEPK